jgi:membrane-associated phospholipid phosphatase
MGGGGHAVRGGNDNGPRINAVDVLNIVAILLLTVVVAFFRQQLGEEGLWLLGIFASLLVFVLLAAFLAGRRPLWRITHDFSPIVLLIVIFNAVGPIIERASPGRWDGTFAGIDARFFGELATQWRGLLARPAWFTDVAYLAYITYYLAPVALGVILYVRAPESDFRRLVFTVVLTFYASYVGYFMFPTIGPRPTFETESLVIGGDGVSHAIRLFLNFAERNHTDAFPSGHTAIALLCVYFARRQSPAMFAIFLPVAAGIIFSTVYLYYHYVIDVVAGAALACGCAWLGPRLEPVLEPREVVKWFTVRFGIR